MDLQKLVNFMAPKKKTKSRFLVKVGDKIRTIPIADILLFYSFEKATYLHTTSNRDYIIDYSLDELQILLDEALSSGSTGSTLSPLRPAAKCMHGPIAGLSFTLKALMTLTL